MIIWKNNRKKEPEVHGRTKILLGLFVLFVGVFSPLMPAKACCTCLSVTQPVSYREWFTTGMTVDDLTYTYNGKMIDHENWLKTYMFKGNILPAMQLMAEQFTAVMLQQTKILGTFFDAKQQLETQRIFQKLQAEAQRDYHPSIGLCEFGSAVRSLASSERRGDFNAVALSQRSMDRQLGNQSTSAAEGPRYDTETRIGQYRNIYCDPDGANTELGQKLCPSPGDPARFNHDIDYASVVANPLTLKVNFTDQDMKRDEQDVFAIAANLYGDQVFIRPPADLLRRRSTDKELPKMIQNYMDARSVVAKRGVAENSFNALIAMKSESPDSGVGSKIYLQEMMKQLGVEESDDLVAMLGENPSYYAQMEVLTKRILESPEFYTNLYDKTANVARKDVALKALSLMQKFDTFKSGLRTEANLSVLLELSIMEAERDIMNRFNDTKPGGAPAAGGE